MARFRMKSRGPKPQVRATLLMGARGFEENQWLDSG